MHKAIPRQPYIPYLCRNNLDLATVLEKLNFPTSDELTAMFQEQLTEVQRIDIQYLSRHPHTAELSVNIRLTNSCYRRDEVRKYLQDVFKDLPGENQYVKLYFYTHASKHYVHYRFVVR